MRDREAFQEVDYRAVFGSLAKWVTEIDDPARIPELVSRAFHVATSGRPGPVVIALPEDMLTETAEVADAPPYEAVEIFPGGDSIAALESLLAEAERPVAILGGTRWSAQAVADFAAFAERFALPVACSFRRQMLFPADHPSYAGDLGIGPNPKLLAMLKDADLVLLVGARLPEVPSQGYTLLGIPAPRPAACARACRCRRARARLSCASSDQRHARRIRGRARRPAARAAGRRGPRARRRRMPTICAGATRRRCRARAGCRCRR